MSKDISHIPVRDKGQLPALLLQHYGQDSIVKFLDDIHDQDIIGEKKHKTFRRMFFLDDSPLSPTSFTRKEPVVKPVIKPEAKSRVRISNTIRMVPSKKRSLMRHL